MLFNEFSSAANRAIVNRLKCTRRSRQADIKLLAGDIIWARRNKDTEAITFEELIELNIHIGRYGIIKEHTGTVKDLSSVSPEKWPQTMCPVDKDGDIRISSRETTPSIPLQLNPTIKNVKDISLVEPNAAIEL
jgi:hypothetical protein